MPTAINNQQTRILDKDPCRKGFEVCEDLCKCGSQVRLHSYVFGRAIGEKNLRFYVECPKCGCVSDWKESATEAMEDFDKRQAEE